MGQPLHPGLGAQGAEQTAEAISEVVQQAVEWTGLPAAPVESRARLLTDRGSGYLAAAFEDYLRALGIRHIYCAPHHPQTNGKLEHFHETLKARLNLLVYTSPEVLRAAMADFIRFHEGIGDVMPADVYHGRRDAILRRRAAQQRRTQAQRVRYNRGRAPGARRSTNYRYRTASRSPKGARDRPAHSPWKR